MTHPQSMPRHASRYLDSQAQPTQRPQLLHLCAEWLFRACAWLGRQRHSEIRWRRKVAIVVILAVALPLIVIEQIITWKRGLTVRRVDEIVNRIGQFTLIFFAAYFAYAIAKAFCSGAFERVVR